MVGVDGTNNRGNGPGPKVSKRIGESGFEEVKVDLWSWRLAWLGVGMAREIRSSDRHEDPVLH